ncbi:MAG TPA: hypothetical protein VHS78_03815 [Candidatus Elarobacter sp.]|jgi:hypothetical protein|nr:hypothetical protein [Candidatus Elarobacter sp.]
MRILDRMILGATWPAIVIAIACGAELWAIGARVTAFTGAAYALAIGLAVAYARLSRSGELRALEAVGIAPRRITASVLVVVVVVAACSAVTACSFGKPAVPTEYAGYLLAALQLPLAASLALPVVRLAGDEQPWAVMALVLGVYSIGVVALTAFARVQGWAPGLEWLFVDGALLAADVTLYRQADVRRS